VAFDTDAEADIVKQRIRDQVDEAMARALEAAA
jgi:hypothetical protein